jgi:hypothetical protein
MTDKSEFGICWLTLWIISIGFNSALECLGEFAGPIIEGLGNILGMHVALLVGGPEPAKRGQINVSRYFVSSCMYSGLLTFAIACTMAATEKLCPRIGKRPTKKNTKWSRHCFRNIWRHATVSRYLILFCNDLYFSSSDGRSSRCEPPRAQPIGQ